MRFRYAIPTTGHRGLPASIPDINAALRALQIMGTKARSTPDWRRAWESVWNARQTGAALDIERAASALETMLRAQRCLADSSERHGAPSFRAP